MLAPIPRIALLLLLACLTAPAGAAPKKPAPPTFLAGGDLSFLAREEQLGAVYKDGGRPRDALQIFKAHGWNVVRRVSGLSAELCSSPTKSEQTTGPVSRRVGQDLQGLHDQSTLGDPRPTSLPIRYLNSTVSLALGTVSPVSRPTSKLNAGIEEAS